MKIIGFISIALIIISCNTDTSSNTITKSTELTTKSNVPKDVKKSTTLTYDHIIKKSFTMGNSVHFTDKCSFYFECDCCAGEILFNDDSTFYDVEYCMSDRSLRVGKFKILDNVLILDYSGVCIQENYNYQNEIDTSAVDYFITDTLYDPQVYTLIPELCENNLLLVNEDKTYGKMIAVEKKEQYYESYNQLWESSFIKRINKIQSSNNVQL